MGKNMDIPVSTEEWRAAVLGLHRELDMATSVRDLDRSFIPFSTSPVFEKDEFFDLRTKEARYTYEMDPSVLEERN